MAMQAIHLTPLDMIEANPFQERAMPKPMDVEDLARSIEKDGLMQYPVGRLLPDGERVQLAFGHRRWMAYKLLSDLGKETFIEMPVILRDLTDEQMAIFAFQENEKRQDINPIERARLIRHFLVDFGLSQEQAGAKLELDRSSIANSQRLLRMPPEMMRAVEDGTLPTRSAMALMPYYEFTPAELAILEGKVPEHADFASLARSGELSSDTIRKTVDEYQRVIAPPQAQPEQEELLTAENANSAKEEQEESAQFVDASPAITHEMVSNQINKDLQNFNSGDTLDDGGDLPIEEEKTAIPTQGVASSPAAPRNDPPQKAAGSVQPVNSDALKQMGIKPAEQTSLNITWEADGRALVSFRRAGELIPAFIEKNSLKAIDLLALAAELGIE